MLKKVLNLRTAGAALLFAACANAHAAWPHDKPLRIVVPFAAGGSTDLIARKLGEGLASELKATVIVENKPGAGGTVGTQYVREQPADGYTILMGSVSTHGSAACIYSNLPYDPVKDFAPLTVVATIPNVLVTNQNVPARNLQEFIALLKQNPGKYSFASNGQGTSNHLAAELFAGTTGVSMIHVPYRGSGPALIDLVGGQVTMMMDVVMTSYPYIKEGKLRALGVTSLERSEMLPDVPTIAESGYPGYEAMVWFGMLAPAGIPADVRDRLTQALVTTLKGKAMTDYLETQGARVPAISSDAFGAMIKDEIAKWCQVAKKAKIQLN